jgi:hypothetical protein
MTQRAVQPPRRPTDAMRDTPMPTMRGFNSKSVRRFKDVAAKFEKFAWFFQTQEAFASRHKHHETRARRLEQIGAALKAKYDLINFPELANRLARLTANPNPYATLAQAVVDGVFGIGRRSQVFYLHPWASQIRMTPAWMRHILEVYGGRDHRSEHTLRTQYFARCWLPRETAAQWLKEHVQPPDNSLAAARLGEGYRYRTGAQGRPTAKHLVEEELDSRGRAGQIEPTLKEQAESLGKWLTEHHPQAPPMKPGTIENAIRKQHRRLKPKNPPK